MVAVQFMPSIQARIADLKTQLATLEQGAIQELMEKRNSLSHDLATVDSEIARLTGKPAGVKGIRSATAKVTGKSPSLQELKELLNAALEKTISIRRDGYDIKNIKTLAKANPSLLQLGGKGAWPTVKLLK